MAREETETIDSLICEAARLRKRVADLERIEAEQSHLTAVLETTCDLVATADPDGRVTYVNRAGRRLLGWEDDEPLEGKTVCSSHPPPSWELVRDVALPCAARNGVWVGETALLGGDGREIPVSQVITAHKSPDGQVEYYSTIMRDISCRKEAERALRESEERYRSLVETMSEGLGVADADYVFTYVNQRFADILGRTREEVVGHHILEFVAEEDRQKMREQIARRKGGRAGQYELTWLTKDGRRRTTLISPRGIVDAMGHFVGSFGVLTDITERKRNEQRQRELEARVLHAQKLESLGMLAGGIAHDFNNLLMGILGNADLARWELPADSPARGYLDGIRKASDRAAELCRQMLAYSGKGRFVVEPTDLGRLVTDMGQILQSSVSKKAMLRYDVAEQVPAVRADPSQIRQVVMNLVINASEALAGGEGDITVSVRSMHCDRRYLESTYMKADMPAGTYVAMEVTDTGCGMDQQTLSRLFEPFFTTKFAGRGLGLAVVLGIVRGHCGAIDVQSRPGQGTTFRVLFPAVATPAARETAPEAQVQRLGTGTILLADDEEAVRTVAARMLERSGYEVVSAGDGAEAVEVFRANADRIACVILDLTMPRMDGAEAAENIRRIKPDVPVVISSGYNEDEISRRFANDPPTGFIQKPYELNTLAAKMAQIIGG
ncbi:MAG TPA: PAS domain S-box protein [Phycisphaerae bacterium]|nr:PAS domain S-box protein [Phycisphaerae bacterium]